MLGTPSRVNSFEYNWFPLVLNCEQALPKPALRWRILVVFRTPGASNTSSKALPAWMGNSVRRRPSTTWPTETVVDSSSGGAATTSMVSFTLPTCNSRGMSRMSLTRTSIPDRSAFLKPASSAITLYTPGSKYGMA